MRRQNTKYFVDSSPLYRISFAVTWLNLFILLSLFQYLPKMVLQIICNLIFLKKVQNLKFTKHPKVQKKHHEDLYFAIKMPPSCDSSQVQKLLMADIWPADQSVLGWLSFAVFARLPLSWFLSRPVRNDLPSYGSVVTGKFYIFKPGGIFLVIFLTRAV